MVEAAAVRDIAEASVFDGALKVSGLFWADVRRLGLGEKRREDSRVEVGGLGAVRWNFGGIGTWVEDKISSMPFAHSRVRASQALHQDALLRLLRHPLARCPCPLPRGSP